MTGDPHDSGRDGPGPEPTDQRAREEAQWQQIIENFGERAHLDDDPPPDPPAAEPVVDPALFRLAGHPDAWELEDDEDRFVPPTPPPLPRPRGLRLAAWLGVFGVPALVLVCVVLRVSLPSALGFLALTWFVGGFGYLVATMGGPRDPGDGWDDGAVV